MPPRKRAVAEVVDEEKAGVKGRIKLAAEGSRAKRATVALEPIAESASADLKRRKTAAAANKQSNTEEGAVEIDEPKKAAGRMPGKAKKSIASTSAVADESTKVDAAEGVADIVDDSPSSTPKKRRPKKAKKAEGEDGPVSLSAPPPGGSKMDTLAAPELPKNTTIDDPVVLDNTPKKDGTTRIMSWNVISLNSSMKKGLVRYIEAEQADVVILTETKVNDVPLLPALTTIYPHQTWGIGKKKGYAGIALLSKTKPSKVTVGVPGWDPTDKRAQGRIITAEYDTYIVIGTYVVNAGENLKTLPEKQEWNNRLAKHLASCDARKPTIWTGDLNVVLDARDLSNASKKWQKSAGYTSVECDHHRSVLDGTAYPGAQPYVDIWRERHPDAVGHYTYYGFRGFCRSKGIGWRLDSFIIPKRIAHLIEACEIRHTIYGASDHLPIYMDIQGTL
ncbi:hypothetical protein CBS101457_004660 [Exobasidium rhododendri]|nr:hypothetical protein CBS101457_004660 [Exobasidium rhododendri]